jgi:hypothetical protein
VNKSMFRVAFVVLVAALLVGPTAHGAAFLGANAAATGNSSLTITIPTGANAQVGDVLIAVIGLRVDASIPPAGWENDQVFRVTRPGAADGVLTQEVWIHQVKPNEPETATWTMDTVNRKAGGTIHRYNGVAGVSSIERSADSQGKAKTFTLPTFTTTRPDQFVVYAVSLADGAETITFPAPLNARADTSQSAGGKNGVSLRAADAVHATPGTTPGGTVSMSKDDDYVVQVLALSAPQVQFSSSASTVNEGSTATSGSVNVALSVALSVPATVQYTITGETATQGSDFQFEGSEITIPAGQTVASIPFTILPDSRPESTETFRIELTGATNAYVGGTILHRVSILDDGDVAIQVLGVVDGQGATQGARWGGFDGEPGETNVLGSNYLKIFNAGGTATQSFNVQFADDFYGVVDSSFHIPISSNLQYRTFQSTDPSAVPAQGEFSSWQTFANRQAGIAFTQVDAYQFIQLRVAQLPDLLQDQDYEAQFEVTS